MTRHLFLLGDSIIDNAPYVNAGEPDVTAQLAKLLPNRTVERLAVDGSVTAEVLSNQLKRPLPEGCDVVLSSGGNDALAHVDLVAGADPTTPIDLMQAFHRVREQFRRDYASVLDAITSGERRVMVFTVYNPRFKDEEAYLQIPAEAGLSFFNDVIQQEAIARGLPVLDIRRLLDTDEDYANSIEPSCAGGAKLAQAVAGWATSQVALGADMH